jgi:DNA-binding transcriptional ArsR family regulator
MNAATHREFKDRLFGQFARIGKALASPRRLEIVDLLAQGERTVEEIARETDMPVASASQHLQALKAARMVEARREGLYALPAGRRGRVQDVAGRAPPRGVAPV